MMSLLKTTSILLTVGLVCIAAPVHSDDVRNCKEFRSENVDAKTSELACTAVIESGQPSSNALVWAFVNRGSVRASLEQYDLAISDFSEAIRLDPTHADAYSGRARVYESKKDPKRAVAEYTKAIELAPAVGLHYLHRGEVLEAMGDTRRALADYEKAGDVEIGFWEAFNNIGIVYEKMKDYQRALVAFTRCIQVGPLEPLCHVNRANLYFEKLRNPGHALAMPIPLVQAATI